MPRPEQHDRDKSSSSDAEGVGERLKEDLGPEAREELEERAHTDTNPRAEEPDEERTAEHGHSYMGRQMDERLKSESRRAPDEEEEDER
jgi:hypothetical protein